MMFFSDKFSKKLRLLVVLIAAFCVLFNTQAAALQEQALLSPLQQTPASIFGAPFINNYTAKAYHADPQNWDAVQDKRGVMYFANSGGLLEFDGERWKTLSHIGEMVRSLAITADGTVFYGAVGDFGYLSVSQSGKIELVSLKALLPKSETAFNDVWQVMSTSRGVYFLTRSRIFRFHEGSVTALDGKISSSQATVIHDTVFYDDKSRGLCLIEGDQIVPIPQLSSISNGKRIALTRSGEHELLVGRVSGDFQRINLAPLWDEDSQKYQVSRETGNLVHAFPTELDAIVGMEQLFLYKLITVNQNEFAISTIKGGIVIFGRDGKIRRTINKNSGLVDNTVGGIMLDRSQNMWAMANTGISHIELSVPQSVFGPRHGIDGATISATHFKGRMYVGTVQTGLVESPFRYSVKTDTPQFVPLKDSPADVWDFKEVSGDLMAATGRGLYIVQGDTVHRVGGVSGTAYCLGTTPRWPDHVFMGMIGGIEVFKRVSGVWEWVGRLDGIHDNVRHITTDADGELWLDTDGQGILRLHFIGAMATQVAMHRIGLEHGMPVLAASRTSFIGNTLFLSGPKGILSAKIAAWSMAGDATRFSPDQRFGAAYSDGSHQINYVSSDGKQGVFIKTSEGMHWLQPDVNGRYKVNVEAFRGFQPRNENAYVHPFGELWLPGETLTRIDLLAQKDYHQAYSTLIRKVSVNAKQVLFEGAYGELGHILTSVKTVFSSKQKDGNVPRIVYAQNALAFEFAAVFFEKPGTTKFQYQLEGFDKNWSEWGSASSKEYTNIPEGHYRFRVKAKNLYDTLGAEDSYEFEISPPWYRTLWAFLLWFLLASAAVVAIVYFYTLRLRANRRLLEQEVIVRTREVVEQREVAVKARHDIALLSEMGREITASLDIRSIQDTLYTHVQKLIVGNTFGIGIVDWERRVISFEFVVENGKHLNSYLRSLDAHDQPAVRCVLDASDLLIDELLVDTRELDHIVRQGVVDHQILLVDGTASPMPKSAIYVPMRLQDKVIGVICVQSQKNHDFNPNDVVILRSLGGYAAVAFDNANAYQRLQTTQEKLVEQEKLAALGSLVAGIAHELNTPLGNSLLTATTLDDRCDKLSDEMSVGKIRRSNLDSFINQAKVATGLLVHNLTIAAQLITSFKQIAVDQTSEQRRVFKMFEVTNEVILTLSNRLRRDEHEVEVQIPSDLELDSFPGPYEQVLSNLIMNSLIHAFDQRKGGKILIIGERIDDHHIKIVFSDNGCGISEQHLGRIFEPFFTTRLGQGGSGLGMHVSYNIITAVLGGTIAVESTPGKGAKFEIVLPIKAP